MKQSEFFPEIYFLQRRSRDPRFDCDWSSDVCSSDLAFVPPIAGEALKVYESAIVRAWDRYAELSALLKDDALAILKELRYVRPTTNADRLKQIERDAEKRAIETARYVVPIAAFTSMVHTVSGIVLHRLHRMANTGDTPLEARAVIGDMVRLGPD